MTKGAETATAEETKKTTESAGALTTAKTTEISGYSGDFDAFAGVGTENITTADVLIPRLTILQDLSPQVKPKKPEFIEGAKPGDICDVGTGEIYPEGVVFLPVYYRKDWLEWAPRASGKGLVAVHDTDAVLATCIRDDKGRWITPTGNLIAETAQWYGLNITARRRKMFIPMSSSQLKRSRRWMTIVTGERIIRPDGSDYQAPIFYRTYKLGVAEESNAEGDWYGWTIARGQSLPELDVPNDWHDILSEAVAFRQALIAGEARMDTSAMGDDAQTASSDEGAM